jgi:hypothetical protein
MALGILTAAMGTLLSDKRGIFIPTHFTGIAFTLADAGSTMSGNEHIAAQAVFPLLAVDIIVYKYI